jgi:hypothetical protein
MPDRAAAEAFIDDYRGAFEAFDAEAVAARFTFPLQVAADADGVRLTVVPGPDEWRPQIERIVGAYRALGVRGATVDDLRIVEVTPRIAHAVVRWSLLDPDRRRIYGFTASYLLVDGEAGVRIAAVAHDEGPKLAFALAKARGGRPA